MTRQQLHALLTMFALVTACSGSSADSDSSTAASASSGGETTETGAESPNGPDANRIAQLASVEAEVGPLPPADTVRVSVPRNGKARGADWPSVVIVVFSDFQCPFCGRLEPTLARLRAAYPDDVLVEFHHLPLPFHEHAEEAAELAEVAQALGGHDAFWRVHDLLFQNQRALEREDLLRYAGAASLDVQEVARHLDRHAMREVVQSEAREAASLGVEGTPTSFINGRPLVGAQPYEAFDAIVREERALAAQEAQQGLGLRDLYERRLAGARERMPTQERPAPAPRPTQDDVVFNVPVAADQPTLGPADALVTIVEFSDFQCPFCVRVEPTLASLRERYGNDIRIVWRNNPLPFHDHARDAAVLAMEAFEQGGNEAFWRSHDLLFENQRDLSDLDSIARQAQLNLTKYRRAVARHTHDGAIEADMADARRLGALGTPNFFINGRSVRGAQPLDTFVAAVDRALAEARAEVARGTQQGDVYAALIRDGLTEAPPRDDRSARPTPPEPDRVYEIAVPTDAPSRGPADAPVVIQEFADFQCPFCSRVEPTLARIRDVYGNRVRFVWRNYPLPFHPRAMPAALAAMEVFRQGGSQAFWAYHDMLFAHQADMSDDNLVQWASQLRGVRAAHVRRVLNDEQARHRIDTEMDPMRAAGARIGTPSFLINGRLVQGAQPFEVFRQAVDRALQEAGQAN